MAALLETPPDTKKKRKRKESKQTKRKLLVDQNVEVRSTEEGFLGSWHPASIIECDDSVRRVRYDHLLVDDGSEILTDLINVSATIEGIVTETPIHVNYRGVIRPVPPKYQICQWSLHYGLCVDAYVNEGWWEGVIFDHEDGSDERLVFFPDLGDLEMTKIESLRITQDWDEFSERWNVRGHWLFLELIEEHEQEWPLLVSVRQLWYDIRVKEAFRNGIKEWTCWVRSLWDDLVLEVIRENLFLMAEHALSVVERPSKRKRSRTRRISSISKSKLGVTCGVVSQNQEAIQDLILTAEHVLSDVERPRKRKMRTRISSISKLTCGVVSQTEEPILPTVALPEYVENISSKYVDSSELRTKIRRGKASVDVVSGSQVEKGRILRFVKSKENLNDSNSYHWALVTVGHSGASHDFPLDDGDSCISSDLFGACDPKAFTLGNIGDGPSVHSVSSNQNLFKQEGSTSNNRRNRKDQLRQEIGKQEGRGVQVSRRSHQGRGSKPRFPPKSLKLIKGTWVSGNKCILKEAAYSPDAVPSCSPFEVMKRISEELAHKRLSEETMKVIRLHLLHTGWKIEFKQDKTMVRVRYINPQEKIFYSIPQVCKHLMETAGKIQTPRSQNIQKKLWDKWHKPVEQFVSSPQEFPLLEMPFHGSEGYGSTPHGETLVLNCYKRKLGQRKGSDVDIEPEYCPQAIVDLYNLGPRIKKVDHPKGFIEELRSKARKHLSAMQWRFKYIVRKQGSRELHYLSPRGGSYISLRTACKGCMQESKEHQRLLTGANISSAIVSTEVMQGVLPITSYMEPPEMLQCRELVQFKDKGVRTLRKRRKDSSFSFPSRLLRSNANSSFSTEKLKNRKKSRALTKYGNRFDGNHTSRVLRSSKRARPVAESNPAHHTPRSILSWLIDNNMVLPRAKVSYIHRKNQLPMAEGRIARDGIRCSCCQKVFGLSSFEVHAGSKIRRPAANIYLEDGRSLLQCQKQMMHDTNLKSFLPEEPYRRIKNNRLQNKSDYICSVCQYGGMLVLCDQCPSAFHLSCIGLEDLPEGQWFCPSCRCGICGQSEFNGNTGQFTEKTVLYCDQCEREYHVGCLRKTRLVKLDSCPEGNWFCSKKCEKIFMGLHKILGKSIPVGVDNLSWTILRFMKNDYHKDAFDMETMTEHHSKLSVALTVMHECFEPIKDPQTKDLVKDVLFNKRSVLKRLNFKGFYTVLLEKEDQLISVATVRVYGERVAEVPLVGTRVQFRRQGMCRILMNLLEKKLAELGVERVLLPAIPQVLHAWTTSFGFSEMQKSERLEFLEYIFLDFQETTMCQKILRMAPKTRITVPRRPRGLRGPRANTLTLGNGHSHSNKIIDVGSIIPKVITKNNEHGEVMEQLLVDTPVEVPASNDCSEVKMAPSIVMETPEKGSDPQQTLCDNEKGINGKWSLKVCNGRKEDKELSFNNRFKHYYIRRKKHQQSPLKWQYRRRRCKQ